LPFATIESDENNDYWYQLGTDMMITKYDQLCKHRSKVQYALEYGNKWSGFSASKVVNTTGSVEIPNMGNENGMNSLNNERVSINNAMQERDFVECCVGIQCELALTQSNQICKNNIRHSCVVCKLPVHGGICGAEASTVLSDGDCETNGVICYLCIDKLNQSKGE